MADSDCRLCGGETERLFQARMLDRFDVAYFLCRRCGSLQTERPHWLALAYSNGEARSYFDVGAAYRTRRTCAAVYAACKLAGLRGPLLDFGGGSGLLCRMLRDAGLDAWTFDEYSDSSYAKAFRATPDEKVYDLVSAFEVFEHLPEPAETLRTIFGGKPKVVVASTEQYRGQQTGWDYLAPFTGQHVFFYSQKAIEFIGKTYGYQSYLRGSLWVFVRDDFTKGHVMLRFLRAPAIKAAECVLPLISNRWILRDGDAVRARHPAGVV